MYQSGQIKHPTGPVWAHGPYVLHPCIVLYMTLNDWIKNHGRRILIYIKKLQYSCLCHIDTLHSRVSFLPSIFLIVQQ